MKYTKSLHNKLLLDGFEFRYDYVSPPGEEKLYYTVYRKGLIEVTVCDSHKHTDIHIMSDGEELSHLSLAQLRKLDRLINSKNDHQRSDRP